MSISPVPSSIQLPGTPPYSPLALDVSHHRDDELWFNDGTLVLVTERSMFRVYGGLLAQFSPVFRDMLQFRRPHNAALFETCPVVHLPDEGDDLRCFLKALFDYEFFPPFPEKTTFDTLVGVLRLSTKYQVDALRKRALIHLLSSFPTEAADYPGTPSWDIPNRDWIRVVNFAREMTIEWILPLALYRATGNSTTAELLNGITVNGVHVELAPQDRLICLEQSVALTRSACAEITDFLWNTVPIPRCQNPAGCTKGRLEARKGVEAWRGKDLFPLKLWLAEDWDALAVCFICKPALTIEFEDARETFWRGLPGRFGLAGWTALEQMKEKDLA